jgi:KDO2-lipid IV(A) lauroyltransferase
MKERRPTFAHRVEYAGWVAASAILKLLPRKAVVALADLLGFLCFHVLRVRRKVVEENLQIAFGTRRSPGEQRGIAQRTYQNAILTFCEFVQPASIWSKRADFFSKTIGLENLMQTRGNPVVFVTGHIGNWEMLGAHGMSLGFPLAALMKPLHNPLINADVVKQRRKMGYQLVSTDGSMKAVIESVRRGEYPVFVGDQDARRAGIFVDFFGTPASTAQGAALFAWKLNLPLLAGFSFRNRDRLRTLTCTIAPMIHPDPTGPRDTEIRRLTEAHTKLLEAFVEQHPDSYFWLHRRWKTRPKTAPGQQAADRRRDGPA